MAKITKDMIIDDVINEHPDLIQVALPERNDVHCRRFSESQSDRRSGSWTLMETTW